MTSAAKPGSVAASSPSIAASSRSRPTTRSGPTMRSSSAAHEQSSTRSGRCSHAVGSRDRDEREEPCPADEWSKEDQPCDRPGKAAEERKEQDHVEKPEDEHVDSLCPS